MFGALVMTACSKVENAGGVSGGSNGGGSGNGSGADDGGSGAGSGVESVAWVDLGLPSGLLWATCNLGADSPEGYGDYYAWGETAPKSVYNWTTYQHCKGHPYELTKYCTDSRYGHNGFTDDLTILQAIDDAATQKLGNGARIPTRAEWDELINNTTLTAPTLNGVNGFRFTAANGRSIFLPAAGGFIGFGADGLERNAEFDGAGEYAYYMSSSLAEESSYGTWDCTGSGWRFDYRFSGFSVRAVRQN